MKKIKVRFNEAQFNVSKFRSNGKELRTYFDTLDNVNKVNNTVYKEAVHSKANMNRTFCLYYGTKMKKVSFFVQQKKNNILSVISTVYALVGYLQSFTVRLKKLLQKICKLNIDWDDSIGELIAEWNKMCGNLK